MGNLVVWMLEGKTYVSARFLGSGLGVSGFVLVALLDVGVLERCLERVLEGFRRSFVLRLGDAVEGFGQGGWYGGAYSFVCDMSACYSRTLLARAL